MWAELIDELAIEPGMLRYPEGRHKIDIYAKHDYDPQDWGGWAYETPALCRGLSRAHGRGCAGWLNWMERLWINGGREPPGTGSRANPRNGDVGHYAEGRLCEIVMRDPRREGHCGSCLCSRWWLSC